MNRILFVPLTLVFVQMAGMVNGLNNTVCAEALNDSSTCISGLSNSNTLVCSGVCQSELIGVTAACENSTDATTQLFVRAIRTLCIAANSPCASAVLQLEADADCTTALGDDDTENYCTGTCRDLIDALLDSCALSETIASDARDINDMRCGTSSANVLKTSKIITLLLVAICTLVYS